MPTTRCYNCGLPGHQTQVCPRYGPRFPEPGKSFEDYADEQQRIMNQIAADILLEHSHGEQDEVEVSERAPRVTTKARWPIEYRNTLRSVPCPVCGVEAGLACRSKTGKRLSDPHRYREDAYLAAQHRRDEVAPGAPVPDGEPGSPVRGPEGG